MENITLTEYMNQKYEKREDKDNIFGVGISDKEFVDFAVKYLLGDGWYVTDPLGRTQITEEALYQILLKYSKKFRKEYKKWKKV